MLSSITSAFRSFFSETEENNRKGRKRNFDDGDDDLDLRGVHKAKRARRTGPAQKTSWLPFSFSKAAEWIVRSKESIQDNSYFRQLVGYDQSKLDMQREQQHQTSLPQSHVKVLSQTHQSQPGKRVPDDLSQSPRIMFGQPVVAGPRFAPRQPAGPGQNPFSDGSFRASVPNGSAMFSAKKSNTPRFEKQPRGHRGRNKPGTPRGHRLSVKTCIRHEEKQRYANLLQQFRTVDNPVMGASFGSSFLKFPSTLFPAPSSKQTEAKLNKSSVTSKSVNNGDSTFLKSSSKSLFVQEPQVGLDISARTYQTLVKNRQSTPVSREKHRKSPTLELNNSVIQPKGAASLKKPDASVITIDDDDEEENVRPHKQPQSVSPSAVLDVSSRQCISPGARFLQKVDESPAADLSWIDNLKEKYSQRARQRQRRIAEQKIIMAHEDEQLNEFESQLEKRLRQRLRLSEKEMPAFEETYESSEEEGEDEFPALSDEQEEMVNKGLRSHPPGEVLSEGFRLNITRGDMHTLSGLNWLNDEVINFYMNLLMERGKQEDLPSVHAFNTFFYPKVMSAGHDGVRRWTRRVDIFSLDFVLVPVHLGVHWCMAIIDLKEKVIKYFDSMGNANNACLRALLKYLTDESLDKKKQPFDASGWKLENVADIPQQMNGSDCGVFACKFAEYVTRRADITFTQEHMPYFRRRMVYEILSKKLL